MSYLPRRGGNNDYRMAESYSPNSNKFSGYSNRSSNNSFDEQDNGIKRKKRNNNKRPAQNSGTGFNPGFKEPNQPPQSSHPTGSPRPNPFYNSSSRPPPPRRAFEMKNMPDFVERQHRGPEWEWQSFFQRSKNWQNKHKLAYYRSRCLALEFENKMLFDQIATLIDENTVFAKERGEVPTIKMPHIPALDGQQPKAPGPDRERGAQATNKQAPQEKSQGLKKQQDKSSDEMEVGTEIKQENKNEVKNQGPREPPALKRKEELDQLYGSSSALIQGLETSIQLNFNRNCDLRKPEVWMAVPLNPETVSS